jgi:hypothetical protein
VSSSGVSAGCRVLGKAMVSQSASHPCVYRALVDVSIEYSPVYEYGLFESSKLSPNGKGIKHPAWTRLRHVEHVA